MGLADKLDEAIRKSESETPNRYKIVDNDKGTERYYDNYLSNRAWEEFLDGMSDDHKGQFEKGGGKELSGEGKTPPKMASFGSSSRFAYNLLKGVDGICFEKKLPTKVSRGVANLDANIVFEEDNFEIFVEAKCREIYTDPNAYQKIYNDIGIEICPPFRWREAEIYHFDIKQLICHFLAIAAAILERRCKPNVKFVYLIYNPTDVVKHINSEDGAEILRQYEATLAEIRRFDMQMLFGRVLEIQFKRIKKHILDYSFEFVVADQNSWREHFVEK